MACPSARASPKRPKEPRPRGRSDRSSWDPARYAYNERQKKGENHTHIEALYWNVSPLAIEGVLAHVRNDLVKLVAEMRAATPSTEEIPSAEVADNALNFVVTGKRARVNVVNAQASGHGQALVAPRSTDQPSRSWRWWGRAGAFVVGAAAIAGVVIAAVH